MREIERMLALLKRPTRLWRLEKAAFLCDCSQRTIRRAIKAGIIQSCRKRIPHSEVVKFCDGRDPLHEFAISIQKLDQNADYLLEKIEHLQSRVEQLQAREQLAG